MYPDPKRVRDNRVVVRLNDYEYELLASLARKQGSPLSTLVREIVVKEARRADSAAQDRSATKSVAVNRKD